MASVKIEGIPELQAALKRASEQGLEVMKRQLAASGLEMETQAKRNLGDVGGVDTGQARAETRYRASDGGLGAEVYSPNPVAAAIEFGTAPAGKLAQHQPPSAPLERWGARHGFPPGSGYLIARKIRLVGIRARPWLSRAHDTVSVKFVRDLTTALNRMLDSL
jgi:hypothetical protein